MIAHLGNDLLPKLMVTYGVGMTRPFRIWCVGCRPTQVLVELVQVLERFRANLPKITYEVTVSDSCSSSLKEASRELAGRCAEGFKSTVFEQIDTEARIGLRRPQDVITCLADAASPCTSTLVEAFSQNLFPGRFLLWPQLVPSQMAKGDFEALESGVWRRIFH